MKSISFRGTLTKSKSLSDLSLVDTNKGVTEGVVTEALLTYTFDLENGTKPPKKIWKVKLLTLIDAIEI